jgi:hypothetical protein
VLECLDVVECEDLSLVDLLDSRRGGLAVYPEQLLVAPLAREEEVLVVDPPESAHCLFRSVVVELKLLSQRDQDVLQLALTGARG